jgi:hypothetical protein
MIDSSIVCNNFPSLPLYLSLPSFVFFVLCLLGSNTLTSSSLIHPLCNLITEYEYMFKITPNCVSTHLQIGFQIYVLNILFLLIAFPKSSLQLTTMSFFQTHYTLTMIPNSSNPQLVAYPSISIFSHLTYSPNITSILVSSYKLKKNTILNHTSKLHSQRTQFHHTQHYIHKHKPSLINCAQI